MIPADPTSITPVSWEERTAARSPAVKRSRIRTERQARVRARVLVDAAGRLIAVKGDSFTTQELAKEAGVALQTFYRYFSSKDELMLAVIAHTITTAAENWTAAAVDLQDPIERLHFYMTSIFEAVDGDQAATALFIVSTHWRLHRILPTELSEAEKPLVDLMLTEIRRGQAAGVLNPPNPAKDAWFIMELVRSVFHHYAYDPNRSAALKADLWNFCLTALGGTVPKP
jgi:TetR/AcrR family transcriptional regulator